MSLSALLAAVPYEDRVAGRVGPDESALIGRIRAGDVRALETVFRTRSAALIRFACRLGASQAVGEEIVTDVFAALWETRERLDQTLSLDAYLFRSVRNATSNTLRGARREIGRVERGATWDVSRDRRTPSCYGCGRRTRMWLIERGKITSAIAFLLCRTPPERVRRQAQ